MRTMLCMLAGLAGLAQAAPAAEAPPLGRLFTTPDERAALDARRDNGTLAAPSAPGAEGAAAGGPAAAPALTVNGVVRRSSGRSTVWLNQVPQDDRSNVFPNRRSGAVQLRAADGRKVILQPGQRYDMERGVISEGHEP